MCKTQIDWQTETLENNSFNGAWYEHSKKQKQNAVAQFSLSHRGNHLTPEKLLNASQLKHFSSIERHCTNVIVQSGK